MEPLAAIGAVANIIQLASAALALSKGLYTLRSAIGSASEDINDLADDLKMFSHSLTLLSRLLEDSRSWYSDDIYVLTAKIIKDCAALYRKIDDILTKLNKSSKTKWRLRLGFVYREGEIRKLLSRLRDIKGTLATILMTLQIDLQLSLLNITCSSKIQRTSGCSLQPTTLEILQDAQETVKWSDAITKHANTTAEVPQDTVGVVQTQAVPSVSSWDYPNLILSAENVIDDAPSPKLISCFSMKSDTTIKNHAVVKPTARRSREKFTSEFKKNVEAVRSMHACGPCHQSKRTCSNMRPCPRCLNRADGNVEKARIHCLSGAPGETPRDSQVTSPIKSYIQRREYCSLPLPKKPTNEDQLSDSYPCPTSSLSLSDDTPKLYDTEYQEEPRYYSYTETQFSSKIAPSNYEQSQTPLELSSAEEHLKPAPDYTYTTHSDVESQTMRYYGQRRKRLSQSMSQSIEHLPISSSNYPAILLQEPSRTPQGSRFESIQNTGTTTCPPSVRMRNLWWQACIKFKTGHKVLASEIEALLPQDLISLFVNPLSMDINKKMLDRVNLQAYMGEDPLLDFWSPLAKIIFMIEKTIGLKIAGVAWMCIFVFLSTVGAMFERSGTSQSSIFPLPLIELSYVHVQEISGIIARYAVMENLYRHVGDAFSLQLDYETSLVDLCSTILEYLAHALIFSRTLTVLDEASLESLKANADKRSELLVNIRRKDAACRAFRIVVDTPRVYVEEERKRDIAVTTN